MSKIGRWHNLKKYLPHYRKAVLLELEDNHFVVSRLDSVTEEGDILFVDDGQDDPVLTSGNDVIRWAYIKLDGGK